MPTWEQIERCRAGEKMLGITDEDRYGSEHFPPGHIPKHHSLPEFTGEVIGHWEIDPETNMPKLVLDKEFLEAKAQEPDDDATTTTAGNGKTPSTPQPQ